MVKRYENVVFGQKNKLVDFDDSIPSVSGVRIVDDSHSQPNSVFIRNALASGLQGSEVLYDFDDGKDNGFTPALRQLRPDPVDLDLAVQVVKDSASKKVSDSKKAESDKAKSERNEKILNNLASLDQPADSSQGSSE